MCVIQRTQFNIERIFRLLHKSHFIIIRHTKDVVRYSKHKFRSSEFIILSSNLPNFQQISSIIDPRIRINYQRLSIIFRDITKSGS